MQSSAVMTVAAEEAVYVVAVFDIGDHVYYFFRELALESSPFCGKTYYSRVGRVCKVWLCYVCVSVFVSTMKQAYAFVYQ